MWDDLDQLAALQEHSLQLLGIWMKCQLYGQDALNTLYTVYLF